MHIEKNIFDNVVNTLLDVQHKSKDNLASRLDMEILGMKEDLHATKILPDNNNVSRTTMKAACYNMNIVMQRSFCRVVRRACFPDGCASSLATKV